MNRKYFWPITVLTIISIVLSSCGAQPTPTAAPSVVPPVVPTNTLEATPVPSPTTPPPPVNITWWHMQTPDYRVARFQELIDAFNTANPGIIVSQQALSWNDIFAKAPAAIAAGTAPDLIMATPDFAPVMRTITALQPVDNFFAEMDAAHKFYPSSYEPYSYDNHVWGVPMYTTVHSLWYHKSVLQNAGITPPTTWAEWLSAVKTLTTRTQFGIGLPSMKNKFTDQVIYDFMINSGASELYNSDGTLRFNNFQTVAAFDFYQQLYKYSPPDSPNWAWAQAEACFNSGTCAMIPQFTVIASYAKAGGDPADLGVIPFPHAADVETSGTISYATGMLVITADPVKQEAIYEFLRFLYQPENYGRFLTAEPGLYLPVTEDGAQASSLWNDPVVSAYRSQFETMIQNSENGMLFGFTGGRIFPSIAQISAQNLLAQAVQKMLIDKLSPAAAVEWGQEEMTNAIK